MCYLKRLPKSDLLALLDIADEARKTQDPAQYQSCFKKMRTMFFFDAAISVYADKTAVDNNRLPDHYYCPLNFSEEFLGQYVGNRHYENSPVFQSTYNTWELQRWKTVHSEGAYCNGKDSILLARSYGYMDGWSLALHHKGSLTFSFFTYAGRKVDYDFRTQFILHYIHPHFAEAQKAIFHENLARRIEVNAFDLTDREIEVLKWLEIGKTTWEISVILGLSQSVIKWHSNNILRKLNAINRPHAVAIAIRRGLLG